jgi:hypothetical protein
MITLTIPAEHEAAVQAAYENHCSGYAEGVTPPTIEAYIAQALNLEAWAAGCQIYAPVITAEQEP